MLYLQIKSYSEVLEVRASIYEFCGDIIQLLTGGKLFLFVFRFGMTDVNIHKLLCFKINPGYVTYQNSLTYDTTTL